MVFLSGESRAELQTNGATRGNAFHLLAVVIAAKLLTFR